MKVEKQGDSEGHCIWKQNLNLVEDVKDKTDLQSERQQAFTEGRMDSYTGVITSGESPNNVLIKAMSIYEKGKGNNYINRRKAFLMAHITC